MKTIRLIDNSNIIEALGEIKFIELAKEIIKNNKEKGISEKDFSLEPDGIITFDITQYLNDSQILKIVDVNKIIESKERLKEYNLLKSKNPKTNEKRKKSYSSRVIRIQDEINKLKNMQI